MKTLLIILALSSSAAMASSVEKFEGKFETLCDFSPNTRYVVEVKYDQENNALEIKNFPYRVGYNAINEGKIVEKYDSETFGCAKRVEETTLKGNLLKTSLVERKCLIPYVIHSHVSELRLKDNGDLVETSKSPRSASVCEFKRINN